MTASAQGTRAPSNRVRRLVGPVLFAALVGIDAWLNGLLGGDPRETISERLGRAQRAGSVVAVVLCLPLELIEPAHCARAVR